MGAVISLLSTVVASPGQISCDLAGETVILAVDAGAYYGLNPVGCRVWSLIQEPTRVRDVCTVLTAEYEVDPATCEREVVDLLSRLADEQLIDVKHASHS
ncbi:MAG: lasso peptide biosynthesis PqqD family chaperone [Actinomycetota bacterium]